MIRLLPRSTLCPYTTLFRSRAVETDADALGRAEQEVAHEDVVGIVRVVRDEVRGRAVEGHVAPERHEQCRRRLDRKSTRLNSSHTVISYAVFCLKKKKITNRFGALSAAVEACRKTARDAASQPSEPTRYTADYIAEYCRNLERRRITTRLA